MTNIDILKKRLAVARGDEVPDLLLINGRIVNVFSGKIQEANIAVVGEYIAGIGDYQVGVEVVDLQGQYVLPGFIDAHVHIESSHLIPAAFGSLALKHGTTAVIADPHEIANVLGEEGIEFMVANAQDTPVDIFYMIPSAVPSTDKETSGAVLNGEAVKNLLAKYPQALGLGEIMNAPGVVYGDDDVLAKIIAGGSLSLDGHYPGGSGKALNAYCSVGINSDHESILLKEAEEKLSLGIQVFIREGSSAKNLEALLPLVDDNNWPCFCFCADDISAADLEERGDIVNMVRKAVKLGMDPVRAVQIGTINPARHYGLKNRGAVAPGYLADMVIAQDLEAFAISSVYKSGIKCENTYKETSLGLGKVTLPPLEGLSFPRPQGESFARVIQVFPTEIVTEERVYPIADLEKGDIAKVMVIERHGKNGNIGFGLVEGTGLKTGVLATTIAHDSHNMLVLGADDGEMAYAAGVLADQGGGAVVVKDGKVLASMPLAVGGLMSSQPGSRVGEGEKQLLAAAKDLGLTLPSPLMTLSFMALPVIPKLKLTDMGLFHVDKFDFVPLYFN